MTTQLRRQRPASGFLLFFVCFSLLTPPQVFAQLDALLRGVGRAAGRAAATQVLPRLIAAAITSSSDQIQDAEPFVLAVVDFIEGRDEQAANGFVAGLINNDINDRDTADRIINAVTGLSVAGGIAAAAAGNDDLARRLVAFGSYVRGSPYFNRWQQAVAQGNSVRIQNGVMVITESGTSGTTSPSTPGDDKSTPAAAAPPSRPNEVVPFLNVIHDTPGARIFLDGEEFAESPRGEYMFDRLPAGTRDITIRDDYSEATITVFVNPGREAPGGFDEIRLEMQQGSFTLSVDPGLDGLSVLVDGNTVGTTPLRDLELDAGSRTVRLQSEWNDPVDFTVDGRAGTQVNLDEPVAARGGYRLDEESIPEDATVRVEGQEILLSGQTRYLQPGRYPVTIEGPRMYPYSGQLTIAPARNTVFAPDIRYRTGSVVLDPVPQGATVTINGIALPPDVDLGDLLANLIIGTYDLTVAGPGGGGINEQFDLQEFASLRIPVPVGTIEIANAPEDGIFRIAGAPRDELQGEYLSGEGSRGLFRIPDVITGDIQLELVGPDIVEERIAVSVPAEGVSSAEVRALRYGTLSLTTDQDAILEVLDQSEDRVFNSTSRLSGDERQLPQGRYLVRARLEDDIEWSAFQTVDVPPRGREDLNLAVAYSLPYQIEVTTMELAEAERGARRKGRRRVTSAVAGGLTVAAGVIVEMFATNVLDSYQSYNAATTSASATAARNEVEQNHMMMTTSLAVAGGLGVIGGVTYFASLGLRDARGDVLALEREIDRLSARYAEDQARRALISLGGGQ